VSRAVALSLCLFAACSNDPRPPAPQPVAAAPPPAPAPAQAPRVGAPPAASPAAPEAAADGGITVIPSYDPRSGLHLDEDAPPADHHPERGLPRQRRNLEIMLRSTPSGAQVRVDGAEVGTTPVLWEGDFTGGERDFWFWKDGYAVARYRFIPVTGGVVHARLIPIGVTDGGVPLPPEPPRPPETRSP